MEVGINTTVEDVRDAFPINTSRGVRVDPGRYEFNEYVLTSDPRGGGIDALQL